MILIEEKWTQFDTETLQATLIVHVEERVLAEYHFDFKNPENDYVKSVFSEFLEKQGKPFPKGEEAYISLKKFIAEVQFGLKDLSEKEGTM